jgi:tRNA pseudouridine38-40 synthase
MAPVCSPLKWRFVYHYPYPLNRARMAKAAGLLTGEHDFASFTTADALSGEDRKSMVRTILKSRFYWSEKSSTLVYQITGTGFLRYMVRNIVGTLMEVGSGRFSPSDVPRILKARDRTLAGPTAPPQGLCLMNVEYDD